MAHKIVIFISWDVSEQTNKSQLRERERESAGSSNFSFRLNERDTMDQLDNERNLIC